MPSGRGRASAPLRHEVTALLAEVVRGSDVRVTGRLAEHLPGLLWLHLMGVLLFWIHDDSPGCAKSFRLVEASSRLVGRLLRMARLPVLRPLVTQTLELVDSLAPPGPKSASAG